MSVIEGVKTYLLTYSGLKTGAPLWVDYLGPQATEYAVVSIPGPIVVETYLDGGSLREFPFAFQSMERTADELERLETSGFYEALADWFKTQTEADDLPVLDAGKTAVAIEALSWAFIYQQGVSDTGIYQVQCKLTYEQAA